MAQLKNTIILGDLSVTGAAHLAKLYTNILNAPTESNGATYGPGAANNVLTSNGTSIYWGGISTSMISGILGVNHGGTGRSTLTTNAVLLGNGTGEIKMIATAIGAFYADAANGEPKFGTLPVNRGGTGATTFTANGLLTGNGTSAVAAYVPAWQAWVAGTSAGPQAKIKLGNVDYTSAAIPSATASASGIVTNAAQSFGGVKTFTSQTKFTYGQDVAKATANTGAVIIGDAAGQHIAMDGNEIMSKASGTTAGTLYLQNEGGTTDVGGDLAVHGDGVFYTTARPDTNNTRSLGTTSYKWLDAHINNLYLYKKVNPALTNGVGTAQVTSSPYKPVLWKFDQGITPTDGDIVTIKTPIAGHGNGVFLSLDNGTNYYPIAVTGTSRLTTHYPAGAYITLVFNSSGSVAAVYPVAGATSTSTVTGGSWTIINYYDSGNPGDWNLRQYTIKAATALTAYNIAGGTADGYKMISTGNAFDIRYAVLYISSAIAANSANSYGYIHHYAINLKNSSNSNITLTTYKNVYIKGTLDGYTFTPYSTTNPYVQDITESDDGYVYYYIGRAYSTSAMTFDTTGRDLYVYKNGKIRKLAQYADVAGGIQSATNDNNSITIKTGTANKIAWYNTTTQISAGTITTDGGYLANITNLDIGQNHQTTHKLAVNGTSLFTGNVTHNGIVYFANGTTYQVNNSGDARFRYVGVGSAAANSSYALNIGGNVYLNGIHYFGNGTTYYINNSGTANLNAGTFNSTTDSTSAATGSLIAKGGLGVAKNAYINGNVTVGVGHAGTTNSTLKVHGNVIIEPSFNDTNSYSQGIRIHKDSDGWASINLGGSVSSSSGTEDGQWLIGRRGAAGTYGAIGDFTIEEQGSSGLGLTIHKDNGGMTLYTTKAADASSMTIINSTTPSSGNFLYAITATDNNMVANSNIIYAIGKTVSKGNVGYIGYQWVNNDNDNNFITIGHHSYDHLVKIYKNNRVELKAHLYPDADNTYDLGTLTKRWKNLYFTGGIQRTNSLYPYIGACDVISANWCKITFPFSSYSGNNTSFRLGFDIHIAGLWSTGVAHLNLGWEIDSGTWFVHTSYSGAKFDGILDNDRIKFYYRIEEPGVLYVNVISRSIWIDNFYVLDNSNSGYDYTTTTIESCAAITASTSPALSAYTELPTLRTFTDTLSTYYYIDKTTLPDANNTYNLGGTSNAWKFIYSNGITVNNANSSSAGGLALYSTAPTNYGIAMRAGSAHGWIMAAQSDANVAKALGIATTDATGVDWNINFYNSGSKLRGWKFIHGGTSVASINGYGYMQVNKLSLNRENGAGSGQIAWYKTGYYTWFTYLSGNAAGSAPNGGTPPTLNNVGNTSNYVLHNLANTLNGCGWMWESASNAAVATTVKPTPWMSLSSVNGQLYLASTAATTDNTSSNLIISSAENGSSGNVALELWRGDNASWQISNISGTLYFRHNYTTAKQTTYQTQGQVTIAYNTGNVRIYSTTDSTYAVDTGALQVDGGASFAKKVVITDTTDSNYSTKAGAFVVEGGANIAKKVYIRDATDSNYATVAGSLVTMGGAYIKLKTYIASTTDSNYATKAGSLVTEGGLYVAKKTYIADVTDSNYGTKAGSLVTEGGLYVAKKAYIANTTDSNYTTKAGAFVVEGGANFGKKVYLRDTTASTSTATGSLVTAGGVGVAGQVTALRLAANGSNTNYSLYVNGTSYLVGVTTHGGNVVSDTNATDNIGVTATRWKEGYFTGCLSVGAASTSYNTTTAHNTYISPASIILNAHSAAGGFHLYLDNTQYARLYIGTKGTAGTYTPASGDTPASATNGTQGEVYLFLGNGTSVTPTSETNLGLNNARGRVRFYGTGAYYTDLLANPNGNSKVCYLPHHNNTMYLTCITSQAKVGDTNLPVYVTANGVVTACSYSLKATVNNATAWGIAYYSTTTNITSTAAGTSGYVLYGNGSAAPSWSTAKVKVNSVSSPGSNTTTYYVLGASTTGNQEAYYETGVYFKKNVLWGACWNDYAECRNVSINEPGRVVKETPTGEMIITTQRLEKGCEIISDTYGFAIGENENAKTPIAATGRVLAYTDKPRETFELGMPVCSGPNGTVSQMTEEEARMYPWCIIGTVSEIPNYEIWHGGRDIEVNGRIWIRIR